MSDIGKTLIAEVRSVAARSPSFVYLNPALVSAEGFCVYVKDGCPSCLIGHALWNLGLIDSALEQHPYNAVMVDDIVEWLDGVELDVDEIKWLSHVQTAQDSEKSWAESVQWADNFKEEMLQDW